MTESGDDPFRAPEGKGRGTPHTTGFWLVISFAICFPLGMAMNLAGYGGWTPFLFAGVFGGLMFLRMQEYKRLGVELPEVTKNKAKQAAKQAERDRQAG